MTIWSSDLDPFFVDASGDPFTYAFMLREFRTRISLLPGYDWEKARIYGFHGLRVLGFNCARAAAGEEVAVLQGGWASDAFKTYTREQLMRLLSMAQMGADYAASHSLPSMPMDDVPVPPSALPSDGPAFVGPPPAASAAGPSSPAIVIPDVPPDAVRVVREASSRSYAVWQWRGATYLSLPRLRAAFEPTRTFLLSLASFGYKPVAAPDTPS